MEAWNSKATCLQCGEPLCLKPQVWADSIFLAPQEVQCKHCHKELLLEGKEGTVLWKVKEQGKKE